MMIEHCYRCLCSSPDGESPEYLEWHLVINREGEYLGIVCAGCFPGEENALVELEGVEVLERPVPLVSLMAA
jgi:hypothetical protein